MKTKFRIYSTLILCAFVILASAPIAFAQRAREAFKYVPEVVTKKTVPYVVNPNLSPAARRGVAAFSEAAVERAVVTATAAQRGTLSTSAVRMKGNPQTGSGTKAPSARLTETPEFSISNLGEFLTGPQALEAFRPGWESELMLTGFNKAELAAIEETFEETDELLFELDEEGNWLAPLSNEWEYTNWFSQLLAEKIRLNEAQLKTLFGKFRRLDDVFTRLDLQAFWLVNKRAPKPNAPGAEGKLAQHVKYNLNKRDGRKMNPEVERYVYGDREVVVAQSTPARLNTPKPSYGPRGLSPRRTPEQVYEELLQFMREHNGEIPKKYAEDEYERKLRMAWDNIYKRKQGSNDPYVKRLIKLHDEKVKQIADAKTPQEILDYMLAYMPEHNGKLPPPDSKDEVAKSHRMALNNFHQKYKDLTDEQVEALPEPERALEKFCRQNIRQIAAAKTPQEILDYTLQYMQEHNGKLPSPHSQDEVAKSNRWALDTFHKKYKDLTDEQVEALPEPDRTLEKFCRQNIKQIADDKTPQEILDYMLAYMPEHNGKLPPPDSKDEVAKSNRLALRNFHKKYKDLTDEQVEALPEPDRTLEKLFRQEVKQYAEDKTPQEILDYMLAYMPEHNGKLPSQVSKDEVEKSYRVALNKFHQKYKDLTDEQVEALPEPARALEKLFRQEVKQFKTPQAILDYTLQYMREHNGKLPSEHSQDEVAKSYRWALDKFHRKYKDLTDEQVEALPEPERTLEKLFRTNVKTYNRQTAE